MKRQTKALGLMGLAALPMIAGSIISATAQSAHAKPPAPRRGKVVMTVLKAKALSKFDPKIPFTKRHRPDFYLMTKVSTKKGYQRSGKHKNKKVAHFNHKIVSRLPKTRLMVYTIRLLDSDRLVRDDVADINPERGKRTLTVYYEPKTGYVFGSKGRRLGKHGQKFTIKGDSRQHRASITFRIDRKRS
ncbi:hypothetical protein IQ266_04560 [filamentous cyanobacterium LEGE 11480]|uniref:Uncharacterized protein n=1 Tax=Romeriopsis navalis LEGE 11480 TaxID=2777977 RepID=A0A928VJS7_9CYAN|nr:hypothetical protein [Romeriopsis navalis]MBE9029033.1 hypothetical protein [Romeriopsis navalis LEGE 11480]